MPVINRALSLQPDLGVPIGRQMLRPGINSHTITNDSGSKQRIATFYLAKMGSRKDLFEHCKYKILEVHTYNHVVQCHAFYIIVDSILVTTKASHPNSNTKILPPTLQI